MKKLPCTYVEGDMEKWAAGVRTAAAGFTRILFPPPSSERDRRTVRAPVWVTLQAFLDSGQVNLAGANKPVATKPTAARARRCRRQTCQRFLRGECSRSADLMPLISPQTEAVGTRRSGGASALGKKAGAPAAPASGPSKKRNKKAKSAAARPATEPDAAEPVAAKPGGEESE